MTKLIQLVLLSIIILYMSGCMSIPEINSKMRQIDIAWELDNQKIEDSHRIRLVSISKTQAVRMMRDVFLSLDMPVERFSTEDGFIRSVAVAPMPLTQEEWLMVREVENPQMREIAGNLFYLPKNPDKYFVTIDANIIGTNREAIIKLSYRLSNPSYEAQGITGTRRAPSTAVKLSSMKIWSELNRKLEVLGEKVRQRTEQDRVSI